MNKLEKAPITIEGLLKCSHNRVIVEDGIVYCADCSEGDLSIEDMWAILGA